MKIPIGKCRSCNADIIWIRTAGGKTIPCDAQTLYYKKTPGGPEKIVTLGGEVVSAVLVSKEEAEGIGFQSHFATCPDADDFRKKEKKGMGK